MHTSPSHLGGEPIKSNLLWLLMRTGKIDVNGMYKSLRKRILSKKDGRRTVKRALQMLRSEGFPINEQIVRSKTSKIVFYSLDRKPSAWWVKWLEAETRLIEQEIGKINRKAKKLDRQFTLEETILHGMKPTWKYHRDGTRYPVWVEAE